MLGGGRGVQFLMKTQKEFDANENVFIEMLHGGKKLVLADRDQENISLVLQAYSHFTVERAMGYGTHLGKDHFLMKAN